jgi:EAL domain-containing protein (putative c-di-GMP-specific phosphodiesterase class I)
VIAEGVETRAQRDFLSHIGCHAYQGYYFGRPAPLQDFEQLLCAVEAV